MDSKETECEGVDWTYLAQNMVQRWTLVNTVIKFSGPMKGREFLD